MMIKTTSSGKLQSLMVSYTTRPCDWIERTAETQTRRHTPYELEWGVRYPRNVSIRRDTRRRHEKGVAVGD